MLNDWVYNGADIDKSKVIWARQMDPASDRELLNYYKGRRPGSWSRIAIRPNFAVPRSARIGRTGSGTCLRGRSSKIRNGTPLERSSHPAHDIYPEMMMPAFSSGPERASTGQDSHDSPLFGKLILLAGIVTLLFAALTVRTYMPCPLWDEWGFIGDIANGAGPQNLHWLWNQQNEHRVPMTRLLVWFDVFAFKGRNISLFCGDVFGPIFDMGRDLLCGREVH